VITGFALLARSTILLNILCCLEMAAYVSRFIRMISIISVSYARVIQNDHMYHAYESNNGVKWYASNKY